MAKDLVIVDSFVNRLNQAMKIRNLKAVDLVERTGIRKQQISQYVNGKFEAKQRSIFLLSQALDVNEAWLMGYDVPMERQTVTQLGTKEMSKIIEEELTKVQYGELAIHLLEAFNKLNDMGKMKAIENVSDLAEIPKYQGTAPEESEPFAAESNGVKEYHRYPDTQEELEVINKAVKRLSESNPNSEL